MQLVSVAAATPKRRKIRGREEEGKEELKNTLLFSIKLSIREILIVSNNNGGKEKLNRAFSSDPKNISQQIRTLNKTFERRQEGMQNNPMAGYSGRSE